MFSLPVKSGWKPAPNSRSEVNFPFVIILPWLGYIIFVINFNKVDLPLPFTPIKATVSPFLIFKLILSQEKTINDIFNSKSWKFLEKLRKLKPGK